MYFFLNRFQKLKGDRATYCKAIYEKLDDKNKAHIVKKGNITANVMGSIYAVLLALSIACAVVSFISKFWWAGVFFCTFTVLVAYLTYSGFSWRKREGYEYAKLFGEEIIYMLGQQERDKMKSDLTVDSILEKVANEHTETAQVGETKKTKKSNKKAKEEFVELPIETESVIEDKKVEEQSDGQEKTHKKAGRPSKSAKQPAKKSATKTAKASAKSADKKVEKAQTETKKVGRPAKSTEQASATKKAGRPKKTETAKISAKKTAKKTK